MKTIEATATETAIINSPDRRNTLLNFVRNFMKVGIDYGVIPGTNSKPTLLKPGSEKLCRLFGLSADISLCYCVEDFNGKEYGEPLFYYRYRCCLTWQNQIISTCEGSCNSWEKKYRYREQKPLCPRCEQPTIKRGENEYYCWKKIGGCGAKFPLNYEAINNQKRSCGVSPPTPSTRD